MRLVQFIFTIFLAAGPTLVTASNDVALVIGNSAYQSVSALPNPTNDARDISEALHQQGFDVTVALNLGRDDAHDILRAFRDKADNAETVVVYYAGHGMEIAGVNYLVPVDAQLFDERDAQAELVTLDTVLDQISGAQKMKMVVLDACRNNPFMAKMKRTNSNRSVGRGLGEAEYANGDTLIAYAAAAGEITPDGESGQNSPFTTALLRAIQGPPMDVRRLMGTVRDEMRKTVPDAEPFVYASLGGGEYVINPHGSIVATTNDSAGTAPPTDPDLVSDFLAADGLATIAAWNAFLVKHSDQGATEVYRAALEKRNDLVTRRTAPQVTRLTPEPTEPEPQTRKEAVLELQTFLKERGCYRSRLDGLWGPGSARGVKLFADRAQILVDLPKRPERDDLVLALQRLSADDDTRCPQAQTTTARSNPQTTSRPATQRSSTPTTAQPQAPAASTEQAPASNCFSFEGQNFCN